MPTHRTDADLMWEMIEHDLPPLETFIRTIAEEQKP
jgi:uncharacterized protein with HEPN domain